MKNLRRPHPADGAARAAVNFTVGQIAQALDSEALGDSSLQVSGIEEPKACRADQLALAMAPEFAKEISLGSARAAILRTGAAWESHGLEAAIFVDQPRYALALVTKLFDPGPDVPDGIHPSAVIGDSTEIGEGTSVGPFTIIGEGARIGKGSVIGAHVAIDRHAEIGAGALIHHGVRIGRNVRIGERFIVHANSVIGSDGYSYATRTPGAIDEVRSTLSGRVTQKQAEYVRVHSLGTVEIADDVEMGACSAIDRGTIAATVVGEGTKIDNHVHIGHNARVGKHCLVCAHVAVAGSAVIGDRVVLAGMVGVSDHVTIGDDVVAAGASKLFRDVQPGRSVMGSPAVDLDLNIKMYKSLRRVPRMIAEFNALKKRVSNPAEKG